MTATSPQVWLITASSSGFGQEIAYAALKKGHKVIATARNAAKLSALKDAGADTLSLDVTSDEATIAQTVDTAYSLHGRIDYLINAAGFILEAAIEEASQKEVFDSYNTNVFGTLNMIRAVLPYMRKQRSGVIANFGSLGSWRGAPGCAIYGSTKWAVSGITEALRDEVADFGITATVIEPGYFRSGFLNPGARQFGQRTIEEYDGTVVGNVKKLLGQVNNKQPGDVKKGSAVIVDVLTKSGVAEGREIPIRVVLGSDCQNVIRQKIQQTEELLDEWKEISYSTDYPKGM